VRRRIIGVLACNGWRDAHLAPLGDRPLTARLLSLVASCLLLVAIPAGIRAQPDCRTIENFASAKVGELPVDWKLRKDSGKEVYRIAEEGGLQFLRAVAKGLGVQAAKEYEWDLTAYPVLVWAWRPIEFPKGSDERDPKMNDSALAVYMLVPYSQVRG